MSKVRVPLYERLPEIYRTKDAEQNYQLKGYLSIFEEMFSEIHRNIEELYDDLFIESCAEWVIPYIGDLLGTSRLKGDPWTLRADVAQTIKLRRRKGTIRAIELLTYNLSGWGVHCVELRDLLVRNQHINHQRPDAGGDPPYQYPSDKNNVYPIDSIHRYIPNGGTVPLRQRELLSLLNTPFDSFAHTVDTKPVQFGKVSYNVPNLAVYFWRCRDYRITMVQPAHLKPKKRAETDAVRQLRFYANPLRRQERLFTIGKIIPDQKSGGIEDIESMPGPMPTEIQPGEDTWITPKDFFSIDSYDPQSIESKMSDVSGISFQLHVPKSVVPGGASNNANQNLADHNDDRKVQLKYNFRTANLTHWHEEAKNDEIIVDPCNGRFVIGCDDDTEADELLQHLLVTYAYGAPGPVGAHPVSRASIPARLYGDKTQQLSVQWDEGGEQALSQALDHCLALKFENKPTVIEITDSRTYELDIGKIALKSSLIIRAADNQRPVLVLKKPLRFLPHNDLLNGFDNHLKLKNLNVKLEGLYITSPKGRKFALITQAALNSLDILNSTLVCGQDFRKASLDSIEPNPTPRRKPFVHCALKLNEKYGLSKKFAETPEILIINSITSSLKIDSGYVIKIKDSMIDAYIDTRESSKVHANTIIAIGGAKHKFAPHAILNGVTIFGNVLLESIEASGVIFNNELDIYNNQKGCIKFSYLLKKFNRLPQHYACVFGQSEREEIQTRLDFNSVQFGAATYGQLSFACDRRIREEGPGEDSMGAFGFLQEAHKLKNIKTRYREFMPIGVRPILIPADTMDRCKNRSKK